MPPPRHPIIPHTSLNPEYNISNPLTPHFARRQRERSARLAPLAMLNTRGGRCVGFGSGVGVGCREGFLGMERERERERGTDRENLASQRRFSGSLESGLQVRVRDPEVSPMAAETALEVASVELELALTCPECKQSSARTIGGVSGMPRAMGYEQVRICRTCHCFVEGPGITALQPSSTPLDPDLPTSPATSPTRQTIPRRPLPLLPSQEDAHPRRLRTRRAKGLTDQCGSERLAGKGVSVSAGAWSWERGDERRFNVHARVTSLASRIHHGRDPVGPDGRVHEGPTVGFRDGLLVSLRPGHTERRNQAPVDAAPETNTSHSDPAVSSGEDAREAQPRVARTFTQILGEDKGAERKGLRRRAGESSMVLRFFGGGLE